MPHWLRSLGTPDFGPPAGLVRTDSDSEDLTPSQRIILERAAGYGARYVFFQLSGTLHIEPVALVFVEDGLTKPEFAELHRRLWSWGAVPLVFRKVVGRVDLLRCAHKPDFQTEDGGTEYAPHHQLHLAADINAQLATERWWDATSLRTGATWDNAKVANDLIHPSKAAHASLLQEVGDLRDQVRASKDEAGKQLMERLLILSLLVGYLEDRGALDAAIFKGTAGEAADPHTTGSRLFAVLEAGRPQDVIEVFDRLAKHFNGDVFELDDKEQAALHRIDLAPFARLVGGKEQAGGQLSLWRRYTFRDLPVELISRIYELFIQAPGAVYTPPFLARILVAEVLDARRCARVLDEDEVILDPACGSGVFLVEAYKRLVLHWRAQKDWAQPDVPTLRRLLAHVHGVDRDERAVELTAFSLCIALCDALDVATLRASRRLFPSLRDQQVHAACFFDWLDAHSDIKVGIVLGNPPFLRKLTTPGAVRHASLFEEALGISVPRNQLAYLFLQRALARLATGGALALLQPPGLLYGDQVRALRARLFAQWDLREVIDLVKIRGLFSKADTKTVCLIFENQAPPEGRQVLHITPARTPRVVARQGLDVDYYDLHWLDRSDDLSDHVTWRSGLLGGRRTLAFARRLGHFDTLGRFVAECGWIPPSEGYIAGGKGIDRGRAEHLRGGKHLIPPGALVGDHLDRNRLETVTDWPIEEPRTEANFVAPLLLIRENQALEHALIEEAGFYAYKHEIVGIAAPSFDVEDLRRLAAWLSSAKTALRAYAHVTCTRLFIARNTSHNQSTLLALPVPGSWDLVISPNEQILIDDIVGPYSELIRDAHHSSALHQTRDEQAEGETVDLFDRALHQTRNDLSAFAEVYARQVSLLYPGLRPLPPQRWSGLVCQPFSFDDEPLDWSGAETLRDRLDTLINEQHAPGLHLRRIVRLYDSRFIFLLKPDVQRFWLRSVALQDADETLADFTGRSV